MMRMRDRNRKRVGRIGARNFHAGQQPRDHRMDLRLIGAAGANHCLFDEPRGIFANHDPGARGCKQANAARLPEFERRLGVGIDKNLLDRRAIGLVREQHIGERAIKHHQSLGQRHFGIGADLTIGNMRQPVAKRSDDPPAGRTQPGIKAKDDQPSFSITASETS